MFFMFFFLFLIILLVFYFFLLFFYWFFFLFYSLLLFLCYRNIFLLDCSLFHFLYIFLLSWYYFSFFFLFILRRYFRFILNDTLFRFYIFLPVNNNLFAIFLRLKFILHPFALNLTDWFVFQFFVICVIDLDHYRLNKIIDQPIIIKYRLFSTILLLRFAAKNGSGCLCASRAQSCQFLPPSVVIIQHLFFFLFAATVCKLFLIAVVFIFEHFLVHAFLVCCHFVYLCNYFKEIFFFDWGLSWLHFYDFQSLNGCFSE